MQYSPKLKKAKQEIEEILKKYDIGAMCFLHTPGWGETIFHLEPSYSALKIEGGGEVILQGSSSHYNGDKAKAHQMASNTVNMVNTLVETAAPKILYLMDLLEEWKKVLDIHFDKEQFTSDQEQGN